MVRESPIIRTCKVLIVAAATLLSCQPDWKPLLAPETRLALRPIDAEVKAVPVPTSCTAKMMLGSSATIAYQPVGWAPLGRVVELRLFGLKMPPSLVPRPRITPRMALPVPAVANVIQATPLPSPSPLLATGSPIA